MQYVLQVGRALQIGTGFFPVLRMVCRSYVRHSLEKLGAEWLCACGYGMSV